MPEPGVVTRRVFLLAAFDWFPLARLFRRREAALAGVRFRVLRRGRSARRYLHIHGNERTAHEVLTAHMKTHNGVAHLVTGKERNVLMGGANLDPNRMFSREGAERNLKLLNPGLDEGRRNAILDRLDRERDKLLRAILPPQGGLLVAVHNNGRGYSVEDEAPISDRTVLNDRANPREFFLATDAGDFEILARSHYNAVLQRTAPPDDDGSLSRLAARRSVRYVNIEAAHGQARKQREMLEWLERSLP